MHLSTSQRAKRTSFGVIRQFTCLLMHKTYRNSRNAKVEDMLHRWVLFINIGLHHQKSHFDVDTVELLALP